MITKKFTQFRGKMVELGKNVGATNKKKLICLTTGEEFDSATKAAEHFKIALSNISKSTRTEMPVKNLYFKYV